MSAGPSAVAGHREVAEPRVYTRLSRLPGGAERFALRPYQRAALDAVHAAEQGGIRRPLVALPTGTGKTVIFAHLLRERGGRALVLAHRDELLQQAADKLRLVDPSAAVGIVKAERDEHTAPVVVASVQTLAQPHRRHGLGQDFATVIVDEAHHAAAASYRAILAHVGSFTAGGPLTVGFTATPERGDGTGLDSVFEQIVYQRDLLSMILDNYLADLRAVQVQLATDWSGVRMRHGDLAEGELGQALLAAAAPEHAAAAYRRHALGRKALVFTPTVAVAHAMAEAFLADGVPAEALDGTTPLEVRRGILTRLRTGATQVVANCGVLVEGFDEPSVDCIIMARPTASRSLYVQMLGRGTRLHPGKEDCLVLDLVGAATRHQLVTAASLFGLTPTAMARDSLATAVAAQRAQEAAQAQRGQLIAQAVDLFGRRPLRWLQAGERFVLTLADGWLALEPTPTGWALVRHGRETGRQVLADGLPLDYAQGAGEDYARALGATPLLSPQAAWRRAPATDKQRWRLQQCGVRVGPLLTRGEASDLIGQAMASRLPAPGGVR